MDSIGGDLSDDEFCRAVGLAQDEYTGIGEIVRS